MNTFRMPPSIQAGTLGAIRYVVDGLSRLPGRKSVVVFSESMRLAENSNVNPEALDSMRRLIDAANRSSVVIHTVDPRGIQVFAYGAADNVDPSRRSGLSHLMGRSAAMASSETGLAMLAEETGGIFVHDDNFMDDAIRQVVGDSTGYYLIGHHPDAATFESPRFHTLKVLVRPAGLHVRTRSGFFGVPDSVKPGTPATEDALEQAVASPFNSGAIHVRLTTLFASAPQQGPFLHSMLYMDARDLTFARMPGGLREARIHVLGATFGDDGEAVDTTDRTWSIATGDADYQRVLEHGMICSINHPLRKPGAYQMRIALRDDSSGQIGSASQFIEVPDVARERLALSSILLQEDAPAASAAAEQREGRVDAQDPEGSSAVRIFRPGAKLQYEYQIFNTRLDKRNQPEIEVQTRFFRDGKQIYAGAPMPLGKADLSDPKRVVAGGQMVLGGGIAPGDYFLQLTVTDKLAKGRYREASQWMDFEVQDKRQ